MFHFELNGEAVWRRREVFGQPSKVFAILQSSILSFGYRLAQSARERVGSALYCNTGTINSLSLYTFLSRMFQLKLLFSFLHNKENGVRRHARANFFQ